MLMEESWNWYVVARNSLGVGAQIDLHPAIELLYSNLECIVLGGAYARITTISVHGGACARVVTMLEHGEACARVIKIWVPGGACASIIAILMHAAPIKKEINLEK